MGLGEIPQVLTLIVKVAQCRGAETEKVFGHTGFTAMAPTRTRLEVHRQEAITGIESGFHIYSANHSKGIERIESIRATVSRMVRSKAPALISLYIGVAPSDAVLCVTG